MTNQEWQKLCREIKNLYECNDYNKLTKSVSDYVYRTHRLVRAKTLDRFIHLYTYDEIKSWFRDYYKDYIENKI